VCLWRGTEIVDCKVVTRPETTVEFDKLPPGILTAVVEAYPTEDGTGVPQARASVAVTIEAGKTTSMTVTMESTIDHLEVSPSDPSLPVGDNLSLTATAKDADGNVVLISSDNLQWNSSDEAVVTVDTSGTLTGIAEGTAEITVEETESGKSTTVTATVTLSPVRKIYVGETLSEGYDMGVNTSGGITDWVTDQHGYMQCNYPPGQDWGAVFITTIPLTGVVGDREPKDFSAYDYLALDLKGGAGGERVSIGVKTHTDPDNGLEPKFVADNLTTDWVTYKIPLSDLVREPNYPASRFQTLYVVCELVFEPGTPAETVCFRNVQFEMAGDLSMGIQ
jgi:hypothetical protein